jgi:hypothetical protein
MKKYIIYLLLLFIVSQHISCTKESVSKASLNSSGKGGSMARFTIAGNYLYMVDKSNLKTYDISDPAAPVFKSSSEAGFEIETIFPFKDKLFIGSTSVVHIFSIEDPQHPKKLSTAISPQVFRRCDPVVAKDSVAYATLRTNGPCGGIQSTLAVYNVTDILNPVLVNEILVSEPYGLGYAGNALYVCDKTVLNVYDISNVYYPTLVSQMNDGEYFDVIADGNTLICWIKTGVALYDISDRLAPSLIASIN